ncbi:MAG: YncE family protein [Pseudomonadota bacterium]|nr:YncE family protein [Pseudomonadota bacterium]
MSRPLLIILLGAVLQSGNASPARANDSPLPSADYGISTIWPLGGIGGWDYLALEPSGARLFVSRGDRVDVVETSTGRRAATLPNTAGVHGIAFAPELKRGYTSNGRANTVTAFELDTLRLIQEAPVSGKNPDAILYEPRAQHVFTGDGASNDISVLDPTSLQVLASIALPGPPEFMVTDAAGTVFVNVETEVGKLVAVDARSLKIKATWTLPGCANPTGLAIDAANHRLFSVCANQLMVVTDAVSGRQIARVAIGDGPDAAAFDADLGFAFSSNGADGTLTVIHQETPDQYRVIATVQTQKSARTMALDPAMHKIYLAAARLGDTPAPTPDQPHPRPNIVPNSFVILVAEPK